MKTKSNEAKSESDETRCWIENLQTQILRVELEDGGFHLCPYAWLVWVQFSPKEETDTVILTFNSHTVSITGKNLRELGLAFQHMRVECVKVEAASNFKTGALIPMVQSITIDAVTDSV